MSWGHQSRAAHSKGPTLKALSRALSSFILPMKSKLLYAPGSVGIFLKFLFYFILFFSPAVNFTVRQQTAWGWGFLMRPIIQRLSFLKIPEQSILSATWFLRIIYYDCFLYSRKILIFSLSTIFFISNHSSSTCAIQRNQIFLSLGSPVFSPSTFIFLKVSRVSNL